MPLHPSKVASVPPSPKTPKQTQRKTSATSTSNTLPGTSPSHTTRHTTSAKDLAQNPILVQALIDLANKKPAEHAPRVKVLRNHEDWKIVKKRYMSGNMDTTLEVLYDDYFNKLIDILPNQPIIHKGEKVPPLDATFLRQILKSKLHRSKLIRYCLE